MLSSCSWRGIANVPLPVGRGTGPNHMTIYVQMPDTLALNANSRVRVADVWVGTVRDISLKNWIATLTLSLDPRVKLPANATAKIGQTSLLGTQHVELAPPRENPSSQPLKNGDTIPMKNSSAYPTVERTLASLAIILHGGGIPDLDVIQTGLPLKSWRRSLCCLRLVGSDLFVLDWRQQAGGAVPTLSVVEI
ncbi:MCE family protein, partial [Mycobacterium xenopi]